MSTEAALLRAIRESPDEDTPRLIYADYLDEEGAASRAEFIRLQVARARLPEYDPARAALEDREHELLGAHECAWLGVEPDADGLTEWEWDRGFVHEVAANPSFMRGPGADLCAAHPVRRWRVQGGQSDLIDDLREAGREAWFARFEALDLAGWYSTIGELSGFLLRSNSARLRELDLTGRPGLADLPEVLSDAPFRDQLKALRCGGTGYFGDDGRLDARELGRALGATRLEELGVAGTYLSADDLGVLLGAPCCQALASLDLRSNGVGAIGWTAFGEAPCSLRDLDLSGTPLGTNMSDAPLDCASLRDLRRLQLNGCRCDPPGLRALPGSRFWHQAEALRMNEGAIAEGGLAPLFAVPGSPALRTLDVAGNWLRDAGVAQLCAAPWADCVAYLDLSHNYLTDGALRTLASSGRFKNLHTLHLINNSVYQQEGAEDHESITDAGLKALADCPHLSNLRVLSVSGTRITAAGVEAVLNSPHWKLSGLRLGNCQLRSGAVDVLAAAPALARLQVLDLSGNGEIEGTHLEPLAESEYLSPQMELDLRGVYAGAAPKVRAALRVRLGRRLSE
jgi:uncharacterized protein (TIGR02996 family)